jgi:RND family efflux transporter MFP subunit
VQAAEDALRLARVSYDLAVKNEINAVALGEDRIKTAERKLAQLKAGPDPADVRAAERAVQSAQLNLQSAVAVSDDSEMVARQEQIKRTIAELDDKATSGKIYAPFDGMVAELGVKPGDRVEAYAPVVNIIDPSRLTLTVTDIATADLARIRPGQVVQIVFARYPGHIVPSTIDQLPADQTSAGSQVRGNSFLRVAFPQGDMKLDLGDTADVTITFSKEPNALWLPPQALRSFDQRTFVVIKDGTQQRQVDIKTGITTADRVQILEGVNEGDVVVGVSAGS